jgi:hypothetical protein
MFPRIISAVLVLGGLALCGLAAYSYLVPPVSDLLVAQTDFEINDCITGQESAFVVRLQNNSGRPIHVFSQTWG